jgi:hypothetical protein
MSAKKSLSYKRNKGQVEITGEPNDVRHLMWFDLITSRLLWIVPIVILLFIAPKASFIPMLWQWVKKQVPFFTLFVVAVDCLRIFLSG